MLQAHNSQKSAEDARTSLSLMPRTIFDDEHRWFRESAAAFVNRTLLPKTDAIRQARCIGRDVWLEAGRQNLLGLTVPAEYGGSGVGDFRFNAIANEEFGRAGVAFASSFGIHIDIVAPYLVDLTTHDQRARWLPAFCSGQMITAIAMTEPDAGSDLRAMRTTARPSGGDWVLNGTKTFITNGASAGLVVIAARTASDEGGRGLTLFAVEEGMPGFERGRKLEKVGQHEADTSELYFADVRIPSENVIGEVGAAFGYMVINLAQERLSAACVNVAHATHVLAMTLDYVKERRAFGRPIGTFQHNRFVLAECVTLIEGAQALVDRCLLAHGAGTLSGPDAAKAKWWTADVQGRVADACLQLYGGYGYMEEYNVARAWQDARVTRIWAGSNEIMKEIVGRSLGLKDPSG